MNRNIHVGLETQSHVSLLDPEHRDFDRSIKAFRSSDHYRFVVFPRQDQHGISSIRVTDVPNPESAMREPFESSEYKKSRRDRTPLGIRPRRLTY